MVRAALQAGQFVGHSRARREHDDAQVHLLGTQLLHQVKPASVWQTDVDDGDGVVLGAKALCKPGQTVRSINLMTVPGQKIDQFIAQDAFVFREDDVCHNCRQCRHVDEPLAEQT